MKNKAMPLNSPIVAWLLAYRYVIAYPLAIVEGPILMMISGFLVRLGFFAFWPIYFVLMAGDLTGDVIWYYIGHRGARPFIDKYGRFFSVTEAGVQRAEQFFNKHQTKILFISKITMGFGFALATLMAAGAARVPFKKYMLINFLGQFVWTGFLMAIGFFLGHLYTLVDKGLRWAFILATVAIFAAAAYGFAKYFRARARQLQEPQNTL